MGAATAPAKSKPDEVKPPEPQEPQDSGLSPLDEARKAMSAIVEEARAAAAAMLEDAKRQAEEIVSTAGDEVAKKERELVQGAQKDFARATAPDGPNRVWLAHEREPDFEPVTFKAKAGVKSELRILRIGRHEWTTPHGEKQISPGVAYQFSRGEFEALSSDVADFLRGKLSFNVEFWEDGKQPGQPESPIATLDKVLEAVIDLDDDRLAELEVIETATHNRPIVLQQIRAGRKKIRGRMEA